MYSVRACVSLSVRVCVYVPVSSNGIFFPMHVNICGTEVAIEWRLCSMFISVSSSRVSLNACVLVLEREHILMHFSQTVWVYFILFES